MLTSFLRQLPISRNNIYVVWEQWIVDTGWPVTAHNTLSQFCLHCYSRQIWFTSWSRPCLVNVIKFAWKRLRVSAAVFVSLVTVWGWGYQIIGTAAEQIQSLDTAWCRGQGWPELGTGKQFCWRRSCELGVKWCFHTILLTRDCTCNTYIMKAKPNCNWWWVLQHNTSLQWPALIGPNHVTCDNFGTRKISRTTR